MDGWSHSWVVSLIKATVGSSRHQSGADGDSWVTFGKRIKILSEKAAKKPKITQVVDVWFVLLLITPYLPFARNYVGLIGPVFIWPPMLISPLKILGFFSSLLLIELLPFVG